VTSTAPIEGGVHETPEPEHGRYLPARPTDLGRILDFAHDLEYRASRTTDPSLRELPPPPSAPYLPVPVQRPRGVQFDLRRAALAGIAIVVAVAAVAVLVSLLERWAGAPEATFEPQTIPPSAEEREVADATGGSGAQTPSGAGDACPEAEVATLAVGLLAPLSATVTGVRCEGDFALARLSVSADGATPVDAWVVLRLAAQGSWERVGSGWVLAETWVTDCAAIGTTIPGFPTGLCA
jgi:hypothetical protein